MVTLRPATLDDAAFLRDLRNDPEVRRQSWQTGVVEPAEHLAWLTGKLADADTRLYVIVIDGIAIGQVRLDRHSPTEAEVSIALAKHHRGRGHGRAAIAAGCDAARDELGAETVVAEIKPGNDASIAAFVSAGFTDTRRDGSMVEMRFTASRPRR